MRIPARFDDLDSFRRWCRSDEYPEHGDVFWLAGTLWVSADMEQAYTHNLIKMAIGAALTVLAQELKSGHVFGDRMRLSNPAADLSCEPDLMFVSFEALAAGRVRQIPASTGGVIEFEGSPEMVLEVTSDSSETKDEELRDLYFAAGVTEYWVVDARGHEVRFDILRRGPRGFVATPRRNGRLRSAVFGRTFRMETEVDPFRNRTFRLDVSR
jgi:Uma2 family endonuclease